MASPLLIPIGFFDKNLCACNEAFLQEIIDAIVNGVMTVAEVRKEIYAAMGAGVLFNRFSA